ncbi:hypothetical protein BPOR_0495g00060 [Botrytis porri]|uniref:Uncharacterized protein n=1 Tax=Botrytis porri TaxID=87229 RepID=A0A4Z1KFZ8_9HELO|nr:hypothetical protein BPOR_0495g00060 [Botrytis porri]
MASRIKVWILKGLSSTYDAQAKGSDSPVIDTKFGQQLSIDDVPKSSKAYDSDDSREEANPSNSQHSYDI